MIIIVLPPPSGYLNFMIFLRKEIVMSDAFVREDQLADVKFYIRSKKDNVKLIDQSTYSTLRAFEKEEYEECHVYLKPLTWGSSCKLQSSSYSINPMTNQNMFDSDKFLQIKLKTIISAWSFTNKNIKGEDVPVKVTGENIDALHPIVADYILKSYNERF
jgi:hypothetical protein